MAISRPFLLALLGAALLAATVFAVQNARDTAGDVAPSAQQSPAEQSAQPAPASASPEQTLASAVSAENLESASFDAKLSVDFQRESGTIQLSGAFESGGAGELPKADVRLHTHAPREPDVNVGFVSTGDRAWFTQSGTGYQVPQQAWDTVVAARAKGSSSQQQQQQQLPLPVDPQNWLRDVKAEGSETIDGVETEHVSARVDAAAVVRDLVEVAEQSGQADSAVLPAGFESRIDDFVKRAELDVYVGEDDDVLRRLSADMELAVPGQGPMEVRLVVNLTRVGQAQSIAAPAKVAKGLPGGQVGELSRGLLAGLAVGTGADPTAVAALASDSPRLFRRALDQKRKVVLFFSQGAADDKATAEAVNALERRNGKLLVLEDDVDNVDAYGKLVEQLGVYQAPAIVIVAKSGEARLIEGYVDAGVLAQEVADAQ